jgi:hypothetical protein
MGRILNEILAYSIFVGNGGFMEQGIGRCHKEIMFSMFQFNKSNKLLDVVCPAIFPGLCENPEWRLLKFLEKSTSS